MPRIPPVKGTHDVLPAGGGAWEWLHRTHERVAASFGYQFVEPPVLEHTELFERGIGTATDVVEKEMFTSTFRGDRSITLRPEGTAGVLRAVLDAALTQEVRPLRLRYAGPMFRYDQPQRGRFRQFFQVGVEAVGDPSPHLDAEVIELGVAFLAALGLGGVSVQVNSLGSAEDRSRFREALVAYFTPLADRLCADCRRRLEVNPLRLLDCKRDAGVAADAPRLADFLDAASVAHLAAVLADLDAAGIAYTRNHRLVRGLDYYAHTTFEFWHTSLQGAQNALSGGGRYDGLAAVLGYAATPGVGYAMGVERLLTVAEAEGVLPVAPVAADVVVVALSAAEVTAAAAVARRLRVAGTPTVLDASDRRPGAKLKAADRLGARAAVLVGERELADGVVALKNLATGEQSSVAAAELEVALATILGAAVAGPA